MRRTGSRPVSALSLEMASLPYTKVSVGHIQMSQSQSNEGFEIYPWLGSTSEIDLGFLFE